MKAGKSLGSGKGSGGLDLASMFGADPMRYISFFIQQGDPEMIRGILDKIDLLKNGSDCMQMSCVMGKEKLVDLFVEKGVDILNPPEAVQNDDQYRRSPYIIQAAKSGSIETFETVKKHGANVIEQGCICLSKKKKNVVISNVVGAAAYYGKSKMLKYLLDKLPNTARELEAMEHQDAYAKTKTPYMREYSKYTPLMLAIAGGDNNLDCVKALLNKGVDYKCEDDQGNTVLHIAAINGSIKILDFLCQNLRIELFKRNKAGETTLSICQQQQNQRGVQILERFKADYDKSGTAAEELLGELEKEVEDTEEAKAKKKQKKWRNKINKIAKAESISVQEVEERLLKQELEKQAQEAQQKVEEAERERQAEIEFEKRKQEVRQKREEMKKQAELEEQAELKRQMQAERQRIEEQRMAQMQREQELREEREKRAAEKRKQRMKSRQRHEEEQNEQHDSRPSLRKEKSVPRQAQHQQEAPKEEARVPRHQEKSADARSERRKSKSQRRLEEMASEGVNKLTAGQEEPESAGGHQVIGLTGELALTNLGKRAKQRLQKKMKKEQEEEEQQKQMMERLYQEKAEQARLKEQEEFQKLEEEKRAAKLAKKKEKEARQKAKKAEQKKLEAERQAQEDNAEEKAEVKKQDSTDVKSDKKKKEWKPKKDKENQKAAINTPAAEESPDAKAPKMVYRQKAAKDTPKGAADTPAPKDGQQEIVDNLTKVLEPNKVAQQEEAAAKPQKTKEKNQSKKQQAAQKKEKKPEEEAPAKKAAEEKAEAAPVEPIKQTPEPPVKQPPKESKPQSVKSQPAKSSAAPAQPAKQSAAAAQSSDNQQILTLQQMLLEKEKELVSLQKNIDKLEFKLTQKDKEYSDLKGTIDMSSNESKLKESFLALNVQLKQQAQLNRLQASQILEFEHALWQAQKQREEAEEKLNEYMQSSAAPMASPEGGNQRSAQDLRVKQIQIRELQKSVDSLQGKATAINALSKSELTNLKDQLAQAQFNVDAALSTKHWTNTEQE